MEGGKRRPFANLRNQISLTKSILVFLVLIFVPVLWLQVYNYVWNSKEVTQKLTTSATSNVNYLADSFREQFDSLIYQQTLLVNSAAAKKYSIYENSAAPSTRYQLQTDLLSLMENISYGSSLLESIELIYPQSSSCFIAGPSSSSRKGSVTTLDANEMSDLLAYSSSVFTMTTDNNSLQFIFVGTKSNELPQTICRVTISSDKIKKMLKGYDEFSDEKAVLIIPGCGFSLSSLDYSAADASELSQKFLAGQDSGSFEISIEGKPYIVFFQKTSVYDFYVGQFIDRAVLKAIPERLMLLLAVMVTVFALSVVSYSNYVHNYLNRPIKKILHCFQEIGQGNMKAKSEPCVSEELNEISSGLNQMVEKLNCLINDNYEQALLLQQAKLHQFQSQIKPHFLYNTFFMLRHAIIEDDQEKAEKLCDYLGRYFRFLARLEKESILLNEEVENTIGYIEIQKMRFQNSLIIEQESLPDAYCALRVPALILQPLIENAIDYGSTQEKNTIRICYEETDESLLIRVEDSGTALSDEHLQQMNASLGNNQLGASAIVNIHNRLVLFYQNHGGLTFERSSLGGCCATIRIPKQHYSG